MTQTVSQPQIDYRPTVPVERCPACEAQTLTERWAMADRYGLPVESYLCTTCGCVYTNPTWTEEEYAEFYRSGQYRDLVAWRTGKPHDQQELMAAQERYAEFVCEKILRPALRREDRTLLDYGGSTGVFARMAADRFDLQCTVVDPAADELERADEQGLRTASRLSDLPDQPFDVITILQTIEHILEPRILLSDELHGIFSHESTLLIVDCVDFYWLAKSVGRTVATKIDHPCNYTEGSLMAMLLHCGWHPISLQSYKLPQVKNWIVAMRGRDWADLSQDTDDSPT